MYVLSAVDKLENRLFQLLSECEKIRKNNEFPNDKFANYVYYDLAYYIRTGRATREFEKKFVALTQKRMKDLIRFCLKGDKSGFGIIDSCKKFMKVKEENNV